jgi:hypothetical protein
VTGRKIFAIFAASREAFPDRKDRTRRREDAKRAGNGSVLSVLSTAVSAWARCFAEARGMERVSCWGGRRGAADSR